MTTNPIPESVVEAVARAICVACEENPDHRGDARGNEFRWQDYRDTALAAINALTAAQQPAAAQQQDGGRCSHEAWEEDGGWCTCVDCGHGWSARTAPPSAPAGVEGLVRLLERIRDLLASLPVDCLGSGTSANGQPYPIRDEVIHGITKALAQQPAAVDAGDARDAERYRWLRRALLGAEDEPIDHLLLEKEPETEAEFDAAVDAALATQPQGDK